MVNIMRKFITKIIFTTLLVPASFASLYSEPDKCSRITDEIISKHLPVSEFSVVSKREVRGVCEVVINVSNRIIPLYGNEDFLISGDMYNNRANITKEKIYDINRSAFLENKTTLDGLAAFEYKPAEIKSERVLYMFTEPLCPYCHKAGSEVKRLSDKYGIKVKVLLVTMKGEEGRRKCIEAACRHFMLKEQFNFVHYNELGWKKEIPDEKYICGQGIELIRKTEEVSNKMNIDGIPLFYLDNGEYVSGADIEALEVLMSPRAK